MLRIIQGGAKTGKSTKIKEELLRLAKSEEGEAPRLWLFVPEQFSFETERAYAEALEDAPLNPTEQEYARALGADQAAKIRVVSFNRFAGDIFREFGGMAGEYANDAARLITMKLAVQDCQRELSAYGRAALRPDFPKEMVQAVAELKNAGISADDLDKTAAALGEGPLTEKLTDLSLLRSVYDGLLSEHYIDGLDDLGRAALLCAQNRWFAGKRVYLDGFKSFTAIQERIIGLMLSQGADVTVALPLSGDSRFAVIQETTKRLRSLAYQAGQSVPQPELLPGPGWFGNQALGHFAEEILKNNPAPFTGENLSVECAALFHEFDEAEFAAARILEYARAEDFAFEKMAVLVRDMNKYGPLLEAAFARYGVPFYMDRVESVEILPLFRLIAHFLEGAANGRREERLAVLKCGLLPVSLEETAAFESYTYVWNLDKDCLSRPFIQHPAGYTDQPMTPAEEEELAGAEKVRDLLSRWTEAFFSAYEEGKSWPQALYHALVFLDIPAQVSEKILALQREGRQGDSDDWRRSWEVLIELLNVSSTVLDQRDLPLKEFISLFSASAAGYTLGRVPQTLDSVLVGSAERVRLSGKKAVVVLGVNEGEFPLLPSSGGLFTDRERQELIRLGLPLSGTGEAALLEERFVTWQALSSPSDRLAIVYSLGNLRGEEKYPSAVVAGFRRIFPKTPIRFPDSFPPEFFCRSPHTAFLQALRRRENTVFSASVRAYLAEDPEYGPRLALLDRRTAEDGFKLDSPQTAEGLFGGKVKAMSPTQIEKFYQCRFRYFCEYGMKLRGRSRAELNPLSRGSALHYLLHSLLQEEGFLTLSQEELWEKILRFLDQYLEETMGGKDQSRRFLYLYRRMAESALGIFQFLQREFAQSEFAVAGVEEPIGFGQRVLPLRIQVPGPDGESRTVSITGQIDRVDTWEKDGETYFRIVDYKSGRKKFDLGAVAQGLNLQMLLYLFAIWRGGREELANAQPAGILYMPIGTIKPSLSRDAGEGERQSAAEKAFAMNGLLLNDHRVLVAMERDLEGKYLPVSQKKDGSLKNSQFLAEIRDFENLEWFITRLVRQMEGALLAGEIDADPVEENGRRPCDYCNYRPICGHEDADGFRQTEPATLDSIGEIRENSEEGED